MAEPIPENLAFYILVDPAVPPLLGETAGARRLKDLVHQVLREKGIHIETAAPAAFAGGTARKRGTEIFEIKTIVHVSAAGGAFILQVISNGSYVRADKTRYRYAREAKGLKEAAAAILFELQDLRRAGMRNLPLFLVETQAEFPFAFAMVQDRKKIVNVLPGRCVGADFQPHETAGGRPGA